MTFERRDLLALAEDDLVVLANRGLVKRAAQEMRAGEVTCEIVEDASGVAFRWSDGVVCTIPADKVVADALCTCPATSLCRHVVRSVLAYQEAANRERDRGEPAAEPWDPGAISDDELGGIFSATALAKARRTFDEGQVVELARGVRPSAVFHTLSVALRFLVAGDARYTHCDCAEAAPCAHVPLAVWAFRLMSLDAQGAVVETNARPLPVPTELLVDVERALGDLAVEGVSGGHAVYADRLARLEERTRAEGLVWPAEILAEIVEQCRAYAAHDARFSPVAVAELFGELCVRSDAIRSATGAVPQLFVRGSSADRATAVSSARLVGLGCGASARRGVAEVAAYLQDVDSGGVVAVRRGTADPDPASGDEPKPFWQLATTAVVKGASLAALGAGQLLAKGGRRTARRELVPGRSPASLSPQAFKWESLREPVLVESFAELAVRLGSMPPAVLRPRRLAEDLHVCTVAGVDAVEFSAVEQALVARLRATDGSDGYLVHPFTSRGREGFEALASELARRAGELRFVAGNVRLERGAVVLAPISAVFEGAAGRTMVQPWVDRFDRTEAERDGAGARVERDADPLADYLESALVALGELLLMGLGRADDGTLAAWRDLGERGAALGLARLVVPIARLAEDLERKGSVVRWDPATAIALTLDLAALLVLATAS